MAARTLSVEDDPDRRVSLSPTASKRWMMRDGTEVTIRLISPEDESLMVKFHHGLSERSVYMRYFESLSLKTRTAHSRLARICFADPAQETIVVAVHKDQTSGEEKILAVGRLSKLPDSKSAEIGTLVADDWQGHGLGTELVRRMIESARDQHVSYVSGEILRDNVVMQSVVKKLGFRLRGFGVQRTVRATLQL